MGTSLKHKRALVLGAGSRLGHALVVRLKSEGYWVRGIDIGHPDEPSPADEFITKDLRQGNNVGSFLNFDEVYQLAADTVGPRTSDKIRNSVLINARVLEALRLVSWPGRLLFVSAGDEFMERLYLVHAAEFNFSLRVARVHDGDMPATVQALRILMLSVSQTEPVDLWTKGAAA